MMLNARAHEDSFVATLKICVISSDERLLGLCDDIVTAMTADTGQLVYGNPDAVPEADLYIWDFDPNVTVRLDQMRELRSIFLVDRKDVALFRSVLPALAVNV